MTNLNENELKVLKACADNALDAAGGDFGFGDEVAEYLPEMTGKQISGYLSQLSQKGMVDIDEFETMESSGTQITFPKGKEGGLKELLDNEIVNLEYVEQFDCWHW